MNEPNTALEGLRIEREQDFEPKPWGRRLAIWLVVIAGIGAAVAWFARRGPEVRTVAARAADTSGPRTLLNASGYVTARREATVSSKVTGKVVEVLIEEGMKVDQGQVLARLDDTNVRAALAYSEAQLVAAKTALGETQVRLEEAQRELRRVAALVETRIGTQSDLDTAQANDKALAARIANQQSAIAVAESELAVRRQDLEDTIIRAPFAGIVTVKNAQPGEMISPISAGGGFTRTGICTLVDMTSLEVEVDVGESYINRVTAGQVVEATLDAYPDWKIPCRVIAIIPTADRQKSTVKVRIGFDQLDSRILPEMAVRVAFRGEADPAEGEAGVVIPKAALGSEKGHDFVWVVKDGRAEQRTVTAAPSMGDETTVTKGLAAGEQVVVEGADKLHEGGRVREARAKP